MFDHARGSFGRWTHQSFDLAIAVPGPEGTRNTKLLFTEFLQSANRVLPI